MSKKVLLPLLVLMSLSIMAKAQDFQYPFNDTSLSEEERIDNVISLMTLDEKIETLVGRGVPRLGIANPGSSEAIHGIVRGGDTALPALRTGSSGQFGGMGFVRPEPKYKHSTAFPQAYGVGSTWDRSMAKIVGEVMSDEARFYSQNAGSNVLILWGPNADLARDPRWGRTEESFGEDPFLVGELVAAESKGIQGDDPYYWKAASLMKHFLANSNEDSRYATDSRFDEDLFRDYYSYGFWKGVIKGGARSLMTAYNRYNGVPCQANDFIKEILIGEWGMDGTLINDAGSTNFMTTQHHYTTSTGEAIQKSLEAGLSRFIDSNPVAIKAAYDEGYIDEELIDSVVRFNLRTMCRLGLMDDKSPYKDMYFDGEPWLTQDHKDKAKLVTQKSVVLLKNDGNLLPLNKKTTKKVAVFGNRAEEVLKDWYGALPVHAISPLEGLRTSIEGEDIELKFLRWDHDGSAQELAKWADVCIVCVGNHPATSPDWDAQKVQAPWGMGTVAGDGRESLDRRSIKLETEDLIKVIWQANHNTVVALISSFPYAINWTVENVPSILHISQCSQELGSALADVIWGDYNPGGRTTQTWVNDILELPNMLDYDIRHGRTYMYYKGKPLFPFGHGLSYTTFKYSKLKVRKDGDNYVFKFKLTNKGSRDGEEVVQLYAKMKGDDAKMRLRGFERIFVKAGESKNVEIVVPAEDLKLWNMNTHSFELNKGRAKIMIGASSADIRLKKGVRI